MPLKKIKSPKLKLDGFDKGLKLLDLSCAGVCENIKDCAEEDQK